MLTASVASDRLTSDWQLAVVPTRPEYWMATPTDCRPLLSKVVSSTIQCSIEFIPINPLAATGSGGPGSYAGHSRFPSRHPGCLLPQANAVFDDAATLDAAVDMLDPQSAGVERLAGSLLCR